MTTEEIQEIINTNFNEFKGSNEATLHAAEDIVELFEAKDKHITKLKECVTTQHDLFLEQCNEVEKRDVLLDKKDKEISDLTWQLNHSRYNGNVLIVQFTKLRSEIAELKNQIERYKLLNLMSD
jgi:hypothetical protein